MGTRRAGRLRVVPWGDWGRWYCVGQVWEVGDGLVAENDGCLANLII